MVGRDVTNSIWSFLEVIMDAISSIGRRGIILISGDPMTSTGTFSSTRIAERFSIDILRLIVAKDAKNWVGIV